MPVGTTGTHLEQAEKRHWMSWRWSRLWIGVILGLMLGVTVAGVMHNNHLHPWLYIPAAVVITLFFMLASRMFGGDRKD